MGKKGDKKVVPYEGDVDYNQVINQIIIEDAPEFEGNDLEDAFCRNYVIDWNGAAAARRAGYSHLSARQKAYKLMTKGYIRERIDFYKTKVMELAQVSAVRNAMELAKMAYGNVANLRDGWIDLKEWDDLTDDEKAIISEIETNTTEMESPDGDSVIIQKKIKIKTHDKKGAIALLNKQFGFDAASKVDHTTKGESLNAPLDVDKLSDSEIIKLAEVLKAINNK